MVCTYCTFGILEWLSLDMRVIIACISFLLLNATPIRAAPATAGATTNSGTSIVQINKVIPSMQNATRRYVGLLLLGMRKGRNLIFSSS